MESGSNIDGIMLELSIAIGTKTGCNMLVDTLPLFSEKLNSGGAMVIKCSGDNTQKVTSHGFGEKEQQQIVQEAKSLFPELSGKEPFTIINCNSVFYHVFHLSRYGLLILHFTEKPEMEFIHKLLPVINHFATACSVSEELNDLYSRNKEFAKQQVILHAVIDNIPDPVYVKDNEGRKILLNKAEAEILGVNDISEALGKKDSAFYPQEVAKLTEAEDRMIVETGQAIIRKDGILTTGNGHEMWIQGTKIPHYDCNGNISGIIGISHNVSEYKKIENELRMVAEKYRSIFNSFVDLYYRSDLEGTILELSPSVYRLSGYKPDELVGKSVSMVYADIESRNQMIRLLIENGSINDFENVLVHKNGKHIPVSITSHLVLNTAGKPGYIEGTIRDISERKETEMKMSRLLKLQNLLTHLATEFINIPVENSSEAVDALLSVIGKGIEIDRVYVFEYDFALNTMSKTHEWCSEVNLSVDNHHRQIPNGLLPKWVETHKRGEMIIVDDISKPDKDNFQYDIIIPDRVQAFITIPMMLNGECIGFVGFDSVDPVARWGYDKITFLQVLADLLCNVNDRKRTEQALRNREASLKAIFNNVPYQMWLKDVDSRYLSVNKPFMDYFSITGDDEIIGKTALDIWDNDAARHFIEQDKAVMQNLELRSVEELLDFKHKSVWFEIFRAPIVDQNGKLLGTTGIARDITNRKKAEKELQEAVEAAEKANRAKSRFLAIMSHEIRNPLNIVAGMIRMLNDSGMHGPNSKLVENIKSSSDDLLMIINDILDFSKIESGEMVLEETSFSIQDLVMNVFNSHCYVVKEKHIAFTADIDKNICHIYKGDPLRLRQVLNNLISNAIKFTSKGKIEIRCKLEAEFDNKIKVCFEVEDTGIGISAENQEKVFEIYKQEDDSISRTYGGSGLGLSISRQIVGLMGGKLSLISSKNKGSKFYFSIELEKSEEKIESESNESTGINLLKGCSILLVEDNKLNQILATTMLKVWEANVKVAGNGQQAIEILRNRSFDVILMDIQMPVMDGITASKLIREELQVTTPILALSANVNKGIVEKCEQAGMQGYISKPFDSDDLYKKIISHVSKNRKSSEEEEDLDLNIIVADVSRLEKMIGSDPVQLNRMINKFLEITPSYLTELNNGNSLNDPEAIALASHKIKSSIDLVASPVMRELILSINHTSRKGGDLTELKSLIRKFNLYYKILEDQLTLGLRALKTA